MTPWKSLGGKFTPEEYEIIQEFQKKLGANENQFVRYSVLMMIFVIGNLIKLAESDQAKLLDKQYKEMQKKISKYPQFKVIQPFVDNMVKSWQQSIDEIIKEDAPKIRKFTKKRKVGRPKTRKKARGRPKDIGY